MQKRVNLVDFVKSFQISIYLQNLAAIQPRMSLAKFARSPRTDRPGVDKLLDAHGAHKGDVGYKLDGVNKPYDAYKKYTLDPGTLERTSKDDE